MDHTEIWCHYYPIQKYHKLKTITVKLYQTLNWCPLTPQPGTVTQSIDRKVVTSRTFCHLNVIHTNPQQIQVLLSNTLMMWAVLCARAVVAHESSHFITLTHNIHRPLAINTPQSRGCHLQIKWQWHHRFKSSLKYPSD